MNLSEFMQGFASAHERGDAISWVGTTFQSLYENSAYNRLESILRWSMLEMVNPALQKEDTGRLDPLFPALIQALSHISPQLSQEKTSSLGAHLAMGMVLSSNGSRSPLDYLGGPSSALPLLKTLPSGLAAGFHSYAAQDLLGALGMSLERTPGVVLIHEWLKQDPSIARNIYAVSLLSRLGENPLHDDGGHRHTTAVTSVATAALDALLSNTSSFEFKLHLSKGSRQETYALATGLVSLSRYHHWKVEDLSSLTGKDKRVARRLEKALSRALKENLSVKSWYPEGEISALCSQVRRLALTRHVIQNPTVARPALRL